MSTNNIVLWRNKTNIYLLPLLIYSYEYMNIPEDLMVLGTLSNFVLQTSDTAEELCREQNLI